MSGRAGDVCLCFGSAYVYLFGNHAKDQQNNNVVVVVVGAVRYQEMLS